MRRTNRTRQVRMHLLTRNHAVVLAGRRRERLEKALARLLRAVIDAERVDTPRTGTESPDAERHVAESHHATADPKRAASTEGRNHE